MSIKELAIEASKVSPPVGVTGLTLYGISLSDFVLLLTAVYTVLMIGFMLRDKWWRQRGKRKG
jgi:hypothetical protein